MKQNGSRVLQNETTAPANKWCIMKQKGSRYAEQNYRNYKSMMHHQGKSSKISRTKLWQKLQSNAIVKQKSSRVLQNKTIETANQWAMKQKGLRFLEDETTALANQCGVKLRRAQDLQKKYRNCKLMDHDRIMVGFCFSLSAACIHSDRYNQPSILQGHWSVHQCLGASCCWTSWLQLGSALVFEYWPGVSFQQQQQPPQHHWSWMAGKRP